jgi:hypothetical protein
MRIPDEELKTYDNEKTGLRCSFKNAGCKTVWNVKYSNYEFSLGVLGSNFFVASCPIFERFSQMRLFGKILKKWTLSSMLPTVTLSISARGRVCD